MTSESSTSFNIKQARRAWMFTINNPLQESLPDRFVNNSEFLTYQYEKGEQGTFHHQGYLVLKANPANKNGRSLKWLKDNIDSSCHWEPRMGTHTQAVAYCNKEDTRQKGPWTFGEWSDTQGEKKGGAVNASKILGVKRAIDEGADEHELYENHFGEMLRYGKAFERYRLAKKNLRRHWMTKSLVLYGAPGTGKSMRAEKVASFHFGEDVYNLEIGKGDRIFWDGYIGQKCVIINEFYGQLPISYLLKLLDRYPMQVETKGGSAQFCAEMIIFTSNEHPRLWYGKGSAPGEPSKIPVEVLLALARRFTGKCGSVLEMTELVEIEDDDVNFSEVADEMIAAAEAPSPPDSPVRRGAIDLTVDDDGPGGAEDYTPEDAWETTDDHPVDLPDNFQPEYDDAEEDYAARILLRDAQRMPRVKDERYPQGSPFRTPTQSQLRRTDSTTLGLERVIDKRIGSEPVQAKIAFKKHRPTPTQVDDDDDVDDK